MKIAFLTKIGYKIDQNQYLKHSILVDDLSSLETGLVFFSFLLFMNIALICFPSLNKKLFLIAKWSELEKPKIMRRCISIGTNKSENTNNYAQVKTELEQTNHQELYSV